MKETIDKIKKEAIDKIKKDNTELGWLIKAARNRRLSTEELNKLSRISQALEREKLKNSFKLIKGGLT